MNSAKRVVAVIPARGGSKGIKKKNLARLNGKSLLSYAVETGKKCVEIERIIVSTDDQETADEAIKCGAEVPFVRPGDLAEDDTPDRPVFLHAIEWLKENEGYEFDILVNLRCTSPLRRPEHISAVLNCMLTEDCDSVRTVDAVQGKNHPYWCLRKDENGFGHSFIESIERKKYYRRQLLPPAYSINALVDAMYVKTILKYDNLYGSKMKLLETDPLYSMDIDTHKDLIICEAVMEKISELDKRKTII
jgi:CMP-N,N'-diacetyllegionaminic acid synthase